MLKHFEALKRRGLDRVIGRTPRDWTLQPQGSYLELHVRPLSDPKAKPWRDYEEKAVIPVSKALTSGAARQLAATSTGGFRQPRGGIAERAFQRGFEETLERENRRENKGENKEQRREKRLAEHAEALALARECLLLEVWACSSDEEPVDFAPVMHAIEIAAEGSELDQAVRAKEDALSAEKLLLPVGEPETRVQLSEDEIDELFAPQLADIRPGEEAIVLPADWSPYFSPGWTLSHALLRTVRDLASYGQRGEAHVRDRAVERAKKASISGRGAKPRPASGNGKPQRRTGGSSLPGGAKSANTPTGPPNAAPASNEPTPVQ